jgi:hypothetical protein
MLNLIQKIFVYIAPVACSIRSFELMGLLGNVWRHTKGSNQGHLEND